MSTNGLTEVQEQTLRQVHELLSEHFDGHVLTVTARDVDNGTDHATFGGFSGGHVLAMGLCQWHLARLTREVQEQREETED